MTCLVPVLRDVPKGEWHCPKCTRDRVYNAHARATAVVNLRKVLRDIETRASLPLKIQLKMLNIAQPIVKCTRAAPSNHTTSEQIPNNNDQQPRFKLKSLPPKFRLKTSVKRQLETRIPIVEEAESPVMCKQIVGKSVQKRMRHLCTLAEELAPLAHRVTDADISNNLLSLHQRLHPHNEYREQPVAGTRTSYNVLSRANKRHRMDRPQVPVKSDPDARQQLHDTEVDDKLKCVSCPVDVRNSRHRSGGFISNGNGSTLENQFRKTKGYADGIPFPADPDEVAYVHRGLRKVEN